MNSTQTKMTRKKGQELPENLEKMSVMYKQGKSYEEIQQACIERPPLDDITKPKERPSLETIKMRCRNQDWIVTGGKKGCKKFRKDHYNIVRMLYPPGEIKSYEELDQMRKSKQK